jgi:hypothetical protein
MHPQTSFGIFRFLYERGESRKERFQLRSDDDSHQSIKSRAHNQGINNEFVIDPLAQLS